MVTSSCLISCNKLSYTFDCGTLHSHGLTSRAIVHSRGLKLSLWLHLGASARSIVQTKVVLGHFLEILIYHLIITRSQNILLSLFPVLSDLSLLSLDHFGSLRVPRFQFIVQHGFQWLDG